MARLILKSEGFNERAFELKLGVNRLGRSEEADFQVEHSTVSSLHCEVLVEDGELVVRDCQSTNGTFFQGEPVSEVRLAPGQSFNIGDVEVFVESTEFSVAIPKFEIARPAPPVVRVDGSTLCQRHPEAAVTYKCTHCLELMCTTCVTRIKRSGGKVLKLCPSCSFPVQRIGEKKKEKKGFLGFLQKTVKMPFLLNRK